jgi:Protein of unknown function (DUF3000)
MSADLSFDEITSRIRTLHARPEIIIEEVPPPMKLAPFSYALTADLIDPLDEDEDIATARFVLLHDPMGQDGWNGKFRCVTFVRAKVDPEMASDPIIANVGWSWLTESLEKFDCQYIQPSGTVTRVASSSFGALDSRSDESELEVRASWTPTHGNQLNGHILAWLELIELCAGLEPLPDGVAQIYRSSLFSNSSNSSSSTFA